MQSFHTICAHARLIMCWLGGESMYRPEFALLCVLVLLALVIMVSDGKCFRARRVVGKQRGGIGYTRNVLQQKLQARIIWHSLYFFFALVITFNCPCVRVNVHQESLLVPCNWRAAYSEGSRPNGSCLAGKHVPFVELTCALT